MTVKIAGFEEVRDALRGMQGRARQNIERKAARASMQKFRKKEQAMWKSYPVKKSSAEWHKTDTKTYKSGRTKKVASYSIRKSSAKAVKVVVGTRKGLPRGNKSGRAQLAGSRSGGGFITYGRCFLAYSKKNAGAAKMAHLIDLGWKRYTGPRRLEKLYMANKGTMRRQFMKALMVWIMRPKAKARQVAKVI